MHVCVYMHACVHVCMHACVCCVYVCMCVCMPSLGSKHPFTNICHKKIFTPNHPNLSPDSDFHLTIFLFLFHELFYQHRIVLTLVAAIVCNSKGGSDGNSRFNSRLAATVQSWVGGKSEGGGVMAHLWRWHVQRGWFIRG